MRHKDKRYNLYVNLMSRSIILYEKFNKNIDNAISCQLIFYFPKHIQYIFDKINKYMKRYVFYVFFKYMFILPVD